ncbi:hypothetical protein H6G81_18485 [Scytonema hofmannii FACHB-248]|uniref:Uncharacterized protein n=1 Tax=Scytonema hofmannii FACHB-248 TaxID=1842502 RepID=A0ABR8GUN8_9CYAN|nr:MULTISPECIES: hypothetical protein [Nostocales]MBD2606463.1 hypothetical protein [Scytonema hofmannii FACHB-248]
MLLIERFHKRLLNSTKKIDYLFVFIIGVAPIFLSIILGIWEPEIINGVTYGGYKVQWNFHSHTFVLPLSLFLLRFIGDKLFGVNVETDDKKREKRVPILTLFNNNAIKDKIHNKLKKIALNPRIFLLVLFCDLIFHHFEKTLLSNDVIKILAYKNKEHKTIYSECVYTFAHLGQFIIFFIALRAIFLLLFHNIFYLKLIYQKNRHLKHKIGDDLDPNYLTRHIVLDFDDPNHRFGLKSITEIFNIQLFVLFSAGVFSLFSRFSGVKPIDSKMLVPESFSEKDLGDSLKFLWTQLYSPLGQYIVVLLWVFTFFVVLLPLFVKFLPFFSTKVIAEGWTISSYLQEFIADDKKYPLKTDDQVKIVASKFAWNAFWPTGDDPARWTFIYVFFIFFLILFPLRLNWIYGTFYLGIIALIAVVLAEIFLNVYRWFLGHVDNKLVKRRNDIKPGDNIVVNQSGNIGIGNMSGGEIKGNAQVGGQINNNAPQQDLIAAPTEIQQLLKQLSEKYPTKTTAELAVEAINRIESDPDWKQRVINAAREGGLAAFEKVLDNPVGAFITGAIKGWLKE